MPFCNSRQRPGGRPLSGLMRSLVALFLVPPPLGLSLFIIDRLASSYVLPQSLALKSPCHDSYPPIQDFVSNCRGRSNLVHQMIPFFPPNREVSLVCANFERAQRSGSV